MKKLLCNLSFTSFASNLVPHSSKLTSNKDINLKIFKKVLFQFIQNKRPIKSVFTGLSISLIKCFFYNAFTAAVKRGNISKTSPTMP